MIKKKVSKKRPEGTLRYRKLHNGIHDHRDGQVVRKGEILYALPGSLGEIIRAGFVCVDEEAEQAIGKGINLILKHRGNGWYDILNKKTGEVLNDGALRAKDARDFLSGDNVDEQMEKITKDNEEDDSDEDEEDDNEDEEDDNEDEDK